jgi:polyhydroxybutyrate depolymerase
MWRSRTARWVLASVVVPLTLTGCSRAPAVGGTGTLPVGSSQQAVRIGGVDRTFEVYRPASLPTGPVPLVVMLHGGFGSGSQAESSYGWDAEADSQHFLVAYPDGENRAWNVGGGCCGTPGRTGVDDVAFVTAVVARLSGATAVDPARIYATGISNGGMLAYRLACDTTLFAAIGPDSATQLGPCATPSPVSVIHVHGTADRNIPYAGGTGDGVARIDGPAVPALNATWRAADGCGPPVVVRKDLVTTSTATCPHGRAVALVTIDGAGHQWPGATARPVLEKVLGLDPPSTALDATRTVWEFFAAHPRPAA